MALRQQSAKLSASGVNLPHTFNNAFPSVPTPGTDVLLVMAVYGPVPSSVTIGGTVATLDRNHSPYDQYRQLIYRARVGASPNRNVIVAGSGTIYITGGVIEVDALAASPLDTAATVETFTFAAAGSHTVTSGVTTQADALIIAQWGLIESFATLTASSPATVGYTSLWVEQNNTDFMGGEASFKFVSTAGAQTATWTKAVAGTPMRQIVAYKLGAAGPTPNTGSASLTAQSATVSAAGSPNNRASATLQAAASIASASAILYNKGTVLTEANDATVAGSGMQWNVGYALLQANGATVAMTASLVNLVNVTIVAQDAVAYGQQGLVNTGSGVVVAADAAVVGTAWLTNLANITIVAQDAGAHAEQGVTNTANASLVTQDAVVSSSGWLANRASVVVVGADATVYAGSGGDSDRAAVRFMVPPRVAGFRVPPRATTIISIPKKENLI